MTQCLGSNCPNPCCTGDRFTGVYLTPSDLIKLNDYLNLKLRNIKGFNYLTKDHYKIIELLPDGWLTFNTGYLLVDLGSCQFYDGECRIHDAEISNPELIKSLSDWGLSPELKPLQCRAYPVYNLFMNQPRLQPLGKCLAINEFSVLPSLDEKIRKSFEGNIKLWHHLRGEFKPSEFINELITNPLTLLRTQPRH